MAESKLSLDYDDLSTMVARYGLGLSYTATDWSTQQEVDIQRSIDKGYADFLGAHDWNFLKKFTTVNTTAPYSTGTITLTDGDETVTLATGTWPSWAAQGTLYYNGYEYSVSSRTDNSDIELDVAWDDDTVSGASYELRRISYTLPDDFGQPNTWFTYSSSLNRDPLKRISASDLIAMRSGCTTTGYPEYAAIRTRTSAFDGTSGQRLEVMFHPLADGAYPLGYSYYILSALRLRNESGVEETEYPLGAQVHAQAICDCCIAAVRYLLDNVPLKEYKENIQVAIKESILKDEQLAPTYLGYNIDRSDSDFTSWRNNDDHYVTVNGTLPD